METFTIFLEEISVRLKVEMIDIQKNYYKFKVSAKNGDIVIRRNGPLHSASQTGIKERTWSIDEGMLNNDILKLIYREIDSYYDSKKW